MKEIIDKLQQLRRKLVDISGRNPLIKCNLTARYPRHIDIVDQTLDDLWLRLASDDNEDLDLRFLPLPSAYAGQSMSIEAIAKSQRINPDLELPIESTKKKLSKDVWTLLTLDRFRKLISRIYDTARLASEEKGISSLYCVLGFLEWTETDHSDVLFTSPLLLVPIQMDNFKFTAGQTGVRICGNLSEGGAPIVNPALILKLNQDFRLTLPQWEEADSPSTYFAKVVKLVTIHQKWRVVPRVVIGNFAFPRLALYEDLNETKWAKEDSNELIDHPLISALLGGFDRQPNAEFNEIIEETIGKPIEGTVFSADSSQLEAIRRVSSGESLVIEGPPGTGKSQTIANIITTAMAQGKTVLFIADKKAAIDVVEQRLRNVGLGSYCLNLHDSSALGKNHMYNRIAERLDLLAGARNHSQALRGENISDGLHEISEQICQHFNCLEVTCGSSIMPARDVLWDSINCRLQYQDLLGSVRKINISDPLSISTRQKAEIIEQLQLVEQLSVSLDPSNIGLSRHALFGINLSDSSFEKREKLQNTLGTVQTKLSSLISQSELISELGLKCNSISDLTDILTLAELYGPNTDYELLKALSICPDVETMQSSLTQFASSCPNAIQLVLNKESMKKLKELTNHLLDHVGNMCNCNIITSEIVERHSSIWKFNESLAIFRATIASICPSLLTSEALPNWVDLVKDYSKLVKHIQETSPTVRRYLKPTLRQSSREHWTTLYQKVMEVRNIEKALLHLQVTVDKFSSTIERLSLVLLESSLWHFLTPSWWKARTELIQLVDPDLQLKHSDRLVRLENLRRGKKLIQEIRSDIALKSLVDTTIDPYEVDFMKIFEALDLQDILAQRSSFWQIICAQSNMTAEQFLQQTALTLGMDAPITLLSIAEHIEREYSGQDLDSIEVESKKREERFSEIQRLIEALGLGSCTSLMDLRLLSSTIDKLDLLIAANEVLSNRTAAELTVGLKLYLEALNRLLTEPVKLFQQIMSQINLHDRNKLFVAIYSVTQDLSNFKLAWRELTECSSLDEIEFFGLEMTSAPFQTIAIRIEALRNGMSELSEWTRMQRNLAGLKTLECPARDLVYSYIREGIPLKGIAKVFSILLSQSLARVVFTNYQFHRFDGDTLQGLRRRFVREDAAWMHESTTLVKRKLLSKVIPAGLAQGSYKNWTDLALIRHELGKQKRRISERQLIARAHSALLALMPCFMMSPLTVAQYLSSSFGPKFDLVLIDEASQMRPEDAISATVRGKQLVVVGDSQQLPPTNFLAAIVDDEEVSDEDSVDNESILDMAKVRFSTHSLQWHYRSRHDSLIHFSNEMFYSGRLIICPSPHQKSSISGVHLIQVDGIYKNSTNQLEAEKVVEKAAELLRLHPDISIGIVAINREQSELISSLLYEIRCCDTEVDEAIEKWEERRERCFVKNLENVQGDERDLILISTVYGPPELGATVMRRFGPINSAVGHRRLNVLFTRARNAMYVFSSLRPIDICPPDIATSSRGMEALAKFLEYAGSGILAESTGRFNRRDPESPFELHVGQLLERAGYEVEYQVGQSGFRIDIGVQHSSFPFGYIAGIECDGAAYHSSISARDRDKLRQEILEDHGWNIYRIWSTDWFNDPQNEGRKLILWLQDRLSALNGN